MRTASIGRDLRLQHDWQIEQCLLHIRVFSLAGKRRGHGCLPFTWANRSVHGLVKWFAKLRTGKFRPGIRDHRFDARNNLCQ